MAGPVFDGAAQLTSRLVSDPAVADTEGAAGRPGGSVPPPAVLFVTNQAVNDTAALSFTSLIRAHPAQPSVTVWPA